MLTIAPLHVGELCGLGRGKGHINVITFEIRPSNNRLQPYYFRIVASNGRVLASSETYVNKQDVVNAVNLIRQNAATANFYDYTRAA